jgi:Type II CAAX prenyl endopeptidase Rce1-like
MLRSERAGVAVQAISFGLFQLHGFPRGAAGVAVATIYGLMMGWLNRTVRAGSLAPVAAHTAADVLIYGIMLFLVR